MLIRCVGLLFAILGAGALPAQSPSEHLKSARAAWDRGDYPAALEALIELRSGPDGDAMHREIALLSGELYEVQEIAADGRSPAISPDGQFASYQLPPGGGAPAMTRIVALDRPSRTIAELPGSACTFAGDSTIAVVAALDRSHLQVVDLTNGRPPMQLSAAGYRFVDAAADAEHIYALLSATEGADDTALVAFDRSDGAAAPEHIATARTFKTDLQLVPGGRFVLYRKSESDPLAPRQRGRRTATGRQDFVIVDRSSGRETTLQATAVAIAAAAATIAYTVVNGSDTELYVQSLGSDAEHGGGPAAAHRERAPIAAIAISPDGSAIAYQVRRDDNWELFVARTEGSNSITSYRLTHEIQHDVDPVFLDDTTVMAQIGEPRHRRAYTHDLKTLERIRLFHNNTLRTIAPQYAWVASKDGKRVVILAERDGNTVSPDRSIYLVDRAKEIGRDALLRRLQDQLVGERALRELGERMYAPIDSDVRRITMAVAVDRVRGYQEQLAACGSRHLTQPGNAAARGVLVELFRSFGYEPEIQPISSRGARRSPLGAGGSANVIARLPGTTHPELVYVLGSHYDSVAGGPGADDNASGTAVTLEAARVLSEHPMPATILFVAFTGEESGLLGSRDFVRQAAENEMHVVGALNNDMLGWANDERIDNTIRYSNPGIRDVQHNAAMRYSQLITYDALYYKSTDAAAFYDAWGDIVGGIGSYPVLGNPHYHQATDKLPTINHEQVAATAKTTVATLMLLASSPSRIGGLLVQRAEGKVMATWDASPERDIASYEVTFGPAADPQRHRLTVKEPGAVLDGAHTGDHVAVRAQNRRGLFGWDRARTVLR